MRDSSASAIIARAKSEEKDGLGSIWLNRILRQADGAQPRAKLDQIADALAEYVIEGSRNPALGRQVDPIAALDALWTAGARAGQDGSSYDGALTRLIRIHSEGIPSLGMPVLRRMILVPGHADALQYLREVATRADRSAFEALQALHEDAAGIYESPTGAADRAAAMSTLRQLYVAQGVKNPEALQLLKGMAQSYRW